MTVSPEIGVARKSIWASYRMTESNLKVISISLNTVATGLSIPPSPCTARRDQSLALRKQIKGGLSRKGGREGDWYILNDIKMFRGASLF